MSDCADGMMSMMGWPMMIGMGVFWILVLVVLLLAAASLVKYLMGGSRP